MLMVLKRTVSTLYISGPCKTNTVNLEIFARNLFSRIALKDIFAKLKFAIRPWCTYISKRQSDLVILREFYFRKTSHMRSFAKIKPSRNYRIYSITENVQSCVDCETATNSMPHLFANLCECFVELMNFYLI